MARIVQTADLDLAKRDWVQNPGDPLWVYNGLDCCLTHEIFQEIKPQLDEVTTPIYNHERALTAPALEAMLRGIKIDTQARHKMIDELFQQKELLQQRLDRMAEAVWGKGLNPNSPQQLKAFFYGALNIPPVYQYQKGERKVSTNRQTLEKLRKYYWAKTFVNHILALRDSGKLISTLRTGIDSDGRMRTSFNVGGTETGRWSSSENAFGTGTNLQNITERIRRIFVADPGYKFAYIDLEQAESRVVGLIVGALFNDWTYLDACEGGDLHSSVSEMVWPGKNPHEIFYRQFTHRDMAKRGGHGTNYMGSAFVMSQHLKVEKAVIERFQRDYFRAFPGIRKWHTWVAQQVQLKRTLTSTFGRRRHFYGRPDDDHTIKSAVAYDPQSTVADALNLGMLQVWREFGQEVHFLAQIHDAILVQYPEEREDELLPKILKTIEVPLTRGGRTIVIPAEAKIGWNWQTQDKDNPGDNPDGLIKFTGEDRRSRAADPNAGVMDWRL